MFNFDFLGQLIGKAARRNLENSVETKASPVYQAVKPIFQPIVDAETANLQTKVSASVEATVNKYVTDTNTNSLLNAELANLIANIHIKL